MSRNILKKRPPASPNMPPPMPMKIVQPKGQPIPIDVNLLVMGSTMPRVYRNEDKPEVQQRSFGIAQITKLKSHSANVNVDRHVLQSLKKSPSVENSYYDRFERLDRDWIEGDTAYKEKGGRVKSAGKQRPASAGRQRPSSAGKQRPTSAGKKRAISAGKQRPTSAGKQRPTSARKEKPKSATVVKKLRDSFFDVAMSFDDVTTSNTKSNAERTSTPENVGTISNLKKEHVKSAYETNRRPRSGKKSRDKTEKKVSERSDSKSSRSVGNSSFSSSRHSRSEKKQRRPKTRKSRSRTRRTRRFSRFENSSKRNSPERNPSNVRSLSTASIQRVPLDDMKQRLSMFSSLTVNSYEPVKKTPLQENAKTRKAPDTKSSASSRPTSGKSGVTKNIGAIDAVRKANVSKDTLKDMIDVDKLVYNENRKQSIKLSNYPRLKMIVAPTATPLATLIRSSSAKMLMSNSAATKRTSHV